MAGGGGEGRGVKSWIFVTFNIIISHIYLENCIEITQVLQKIWRLSLSIVAIFIDFCHVLGFFDISLNKETNGATL